MESTSASGGRTSADVPADLPTGQDMPFLPLQSVQSEYQLPHELRTAVHESAVEIVATECRCVDWGAPALRSVELAEEAVTRIVSFALASFQSRLQRKIEAMFGLVHATDGEFSPLQQELVRELYGPVTPD